MLGSSQAIWPSEWLSQALTFNDKNELHFGLIQPKGGPCGILAALQGFILQYLLFSELRDDSRFVLCVFLRWWPALVSCSDGRHLVAVE
jgi:hypothetical protein